MLARLFTATVRDALPFGTADAAIADDGRLLGGRVAPTWGVPLEHLAQAAVDADVAWSGLGGARRLPGLRAHGGLGTPEPWREDAAGVTPLSRRRVAIGLDSEEPI